MRSVSPTWVYATACPLTATDETVMPLACPAPRPTRSSQNSRTPSAVMRTRTVACPEITSASSRSVIAKR